MPSKPLVLISQIQRSGGTLLSQLLDGHPQILSYPSECYLLKGGYPRALLAKYYLAKLNNTNIIKILPKRLKSRDLFESDDFFWRKYNKEGYQKFSIKKGPTKDFSFNFEKRDQVFKATIGKSILPSDRKILDAFFYSFFSGWENYKDNIDDNKKYITAFSPNFFDTNISNKGNSPFFSTYPDGFIITMARNPVSWLASAKRHSSKYAENAFIKYYIPSLQRSLDYYQSYPNKVIPIVFEELVADTEKVMKKLSNQIGLEYFPCLTTPTYNGELVSSDSSFSSKTGVDKSAINREADIIETKKDPFFSQANDLYNSFCDLSN